MAKNFPEGKAAKNIRRGGMDRRLASAPRGLGARMNEAAAAHNRAQAGAVGVRRVGSGDRPYVPYVRGAPLKSPTGRTRRYKTEKAARLAAVAAIQNQE